MNKHKLQTRHTPTGRLFVSAETDDGKVIASSRHTHTAAEKACTDCEQVLYGKPAQTELAPGLKFRIMVWKVGPVVILILLVLLFLQIAAGG